MMRLPFLAFMKSYLAKPHPRNGGGGSLTLSFSLSPCLSRQLSFSFISSAQIVTTVQAKKISAWENLIKK